MFITPSAQLSCLLLVILFPRFLRRRKTLLKLIHAALPRKGRQHVKIRLALLKVSLFIHLTTAEARRLCKDPLLFAYELTSRFSSHRAPSVPNLKRQLRCLSPQQIDFSVKTLFCAAKQSHFKLERFFFLLSSFGRKLKYESDDVKQEKEIETVGS